jgi:hypothetical protein
MARSGDQIQTNGEYLARVLRVGYYARTAACPKDCPKMEFCPDRRQSDRIEMHVGAHERNRSSLGVEQYSI